jgi:hypothetical protein
MDILHFTPGSLTTVGAREKGGAYLPLASGIGDTEISCLYLPAGAQIALASSERSQLLLMVNGRAEAMLQLRHSLRSQLSGGMGMLLHPSEHGQLSSLTGAILVTIETELLVADPCRILLPERGWVSYGRIWRATDQHRVVTLAGGSPIHTAGRGLRSAVRI